MKLTPPALLSSLTSIDRLDPLVEQAREEEEPLEGLLLDHLVLSGPDLSGLTFRSVRFSHCRMAGAFFHRASLEDCVFEHCDLSNADMGGSYMLRTAFSDCKGVGLDVRKARLRDVSFENCQLKYLNLNTGKLRAVRFSRCDLEGAFLSGCSLNGLELHETRLIQTSFFQTALSGVDFTSSTLEAPALSDSATELKGAIVDFYQAAGLAKRFGLVIKE